MTCNATSVIVKIASLATTFRCLTLTLTAMLALDGMFSETNIGRCYLCQPIIAFYCQWR